MNEVGAVALLLAGMFGFVAAPWVLVLGSLWVWDRVKRDRGADRG